MNYEETLTTLQFASRAIKIKIEAKINEKIETKKIQEKVIEFKTIMDTSKDYTKKTLARSRSQTEDIILQEDNNELVKKFQMMVIHLQNELSKNVRF
jgi:hypothetical protein